MTAPTAFDRYDPPLSTSSPLAATHYIDGVDRLLGFDLDADVRLQEAIDADPGFALAHAALALHFQSQTRVPEARAAAARAQELTGGVTPRERGHVAAVVALTEGGGPPALALLLEQLAEFPREMLLLRQAVFQLQMSGAPDARERIVALVDTLVPVYGDDWAFLGGYAMQLQELDRFAEARRCAERSLAGNPRNALAAHPIAHVHYETDDHDDGATFLSSWLVDHYDRRTPYHHHLSWHLALFELAAGRYSRVMQIYERDILPVAHARAGLPVADATSLLWHLQVYGCAAAPLDWEALRPRVEPALARPGFSFTDAHHGLWCAASGDEAALARLVDGLRDLDAKGHPLAGPVTLPLVQGIAAFARGDYEACIAQIAPLTDQIVRIGGSHAQREVFEDTLVEAYLRAGRFDDAERLLRRRLGRRSSARDLFWLGRVGAGRGDGAAARDSLDAAAAHWRGAEREGPEQAALTKMRAEVATGTAQTTSAH